MTLYLQLFYEFFKTGLFALGGGLATIPFLSQMADNLGWFTQATLADMIAISESTPGPIGVNMATYTGFTMLGIPGAIVATLGLVTPSIIVIIIIAQFLNKFKDSIYVNAVFEGIRPAVVGLILTALVGIFTSSVVFPELAKASGNWLDMFSLKTTILFIAVLIGSKKINVHPIVWIGLSALIGILFQF